MLKIPCQVIFVLVLLPYLASTLHLYYAIDRTTRYVSDSISLKEMTACKDTCLKMKKVYPGMHFRVQLTIICSSTD
jgi:hypothetical protein